MNLAQFLAKKKMNDEQLAVEIGVTAGMVRNWRENKHSPRLLHAVKIKNFSKNKVKVEDLLSNKDLKAIK